MLLPFDITWAHLPAAIGLLTVQNVKVANSETASTLMRGCVGLL